MVVNHLQAELRQPNRKLIFIQNETRDNRHGSL
jgi:hypothetical protein